MGVERQPDEAEFAERPVREQADGCGRGASAARPGCDPVADLGALRFPVEAQERDRAEEAVVVGVGDCQRELGACLAQRGLCVEEGARLVECRLRGDAREPVDERILDRKSVV